MSDSIAPILAVGNPYSLTIVEHSADVFALLGVDLCRVIRSVGNGSSSIAR